MISAINPRINVLTALGTVPVRVRQQGHGAPRLVAGDRNHDGAGQSPKWNRNSVAHTMVAIPAAAVAHNAGEPEESKVTTTAKMRK